MVPTGPGRGWAHVCRAQTVGVDCAESPEESPENSGKTQFNGDRTWSRQQGAFAAAIRRVLARHWRSKAVAGWRAGSAAVTGVRYACLPAGQPAPCSREGRAHRRGLAGRRRHRRQPDPRHLGHPARPGGRCGARIIHRDDSAARLPVHCRCRSGRLTGADSSGAHPRGTGAGAAAPAAELVRTMAHLRYRDGSNRTPVARRRHGVSSGRGPGP
jgi:hypothetical protein